MQRHLTEASHVVGKIGHQKLKKIIQTKVQGKALYYL